ncbi:MAG: hypothetical protein H7841_09470 [Magnetospirillum sp. WYHS-4]
MVRSCRHRSLLAAALWLAEALRSPFDHTDSMKIAEFDVMGRRFRIPRAYLSLREQWFGAKSPGPILMGALLPDLGPYTRDKAVKVDFYLQAIKFNPGAFVKYYAPEFLATCQGEVAGFLRCPDWQAEHEILVRIDGERKVALDCDQQRGRSATGEELNALCEGQFPLVDNVKLSLRFERMHLERTDEIVARVFGIVCGFFVPELSGPLTYNFCENGVYTHGQAK